MYVGVNAGRMRLRVIAEPGAYQFLFFRHRPVNYNIKLYAQNEIVLHTRRIRRGF